MALQGCFHFQLNYQIMHDGYYTVVSQTTVFETVSRTQNFLPICA